MNLRRERIVILLAVLIVCIALIACGSVDVYFKTAWATGQERTVSYNDSTNSDGSVTYTFTTDDGSCTVRPKSVTIKLPGSFTVSETCSDIQTGPTSQDTQTSSATVTVNADGSISSVGTGIRLVKT